MLQHCQDGRRWRHVSRTDWKGYQSVRYRDCSGTHICGNSNCNFVTQYGEPNKTKFKKTGTSEYCGDSGVHIECNARKYVAFFNDTEADVYHGKHTCTAKGISVRPSQLVRSKDILTKSSKIQNNAVISLLRNRSSWDDIDEVVRETASLRKISNEKIKQKKILETSQGYPDVKELKDFVDLRDKFFIYELNENEQFVFKTSTNQIKLAMKMDYTESHFLGEEYCCFDGNHKRAKDYVTLTPSVYHPLLRKQVVLATMQYIYFIFQFIYSRRST